MVPLAIFRDGSADCKEVVWHDENIGEEMEQYWNLFHIKITPLVDGEENGEPWMILFKDPDLLRHVKLHANSQSSLVEAYGTKYPFDEYVNMKLYVMFVELMDYITEKVFCPLTIQSLQNELSTLIQSSEFTWELSTDAVSQENS